MDLKIRKLEELDIPFLWDMLYESAFVPEGLDPFPRTILHEPSVSKYVDGWGGQIGDIGLIAEVKGESVGAIWLRLFDETPEIGMALVREFRGKGIGKILLNAVEIEARKFGYQKLYLSVNPANPALYLYKKCGYVKVGWFETHWIMEKSLG